MRIPNSSSFARTSDSRPLVRSIGVAALATLLVGSLACGGAGKKEVQGIEQDPIEFEDPPDTAGTDGATTDKPTHLKIVALTMDVEGQQLAIAEDGSVTSGPNKVGTITVGGEFLAANGGLYGTLMPDGSMIKAHVNLDRFKDFKIGEDGLLYKGDAAANEISEEGVVSENGKVAYTVTGPVEGRRAAMFVYMVLLGSVMDAQEKAGGTPPTPETPETPETAPDAGGN